MARMERGAWNGGDVHQLRYRLGLSQRELAALLGVRQQTVSDWERGLHAPQGASRLLLSLAEERAPYVAEPRAGPRLGWPVAAP